MKQVAQQFSRKNVWPNKKTMLITAYLGASLAASGVNAADTIKLQPQQQVAAATAEIPLHQHDSVQLITPAPVTNQAQQPVLPTVPEQRETDSKTIDSNATGQNIAALVPDNNTIVIVNRPQVTGLWALSFAGARCTEYYNFMENGEVAIKSGEEWTYGNYVYQIPAVAEPGSPVLAMRIKYDNQKTDCSGNAIDQRGEEQQQYVKWNSPSTMDFCAAQDGQQCFASLRRILP